MHCRRTGPKRVLTLLACCYRRGPIGGNQNTRIIFIVSIRRDRSFKVKRHVTIAHKKHLRAKNKQVSWSDDARRHDKKTFDVNFKGFSKAYDIARTTLKLPPDVQLERISDLESLNRLTESAVAKHHCAEIGYARADIIVKAHVVVKSGAQKLSDLLG